MNKKVVRFERETTVKDDICYESGSFKPITDGIGCSNCRVHLLTDRFLSKKFQKEIMKDERDFPYGVYPYVIIIDTAYCNLRCRGCYSWIYWKPEPRAMATSVDESTLAKQFRCKIEKLHDENLINKKPRIAEKTKRPFSRLRISGGEPLFDSKTNLNSFSEDSSADFCLSFFKKLDQEFKQIISDEKISLKSEKEWILMSNEAKKKWFPIFLKSDNGKIRIRFDTNEWLFKDKDFCEKFIEGFYNLKLEHIKMDLTFSIKGTNSYEVQWFTNHNSKFDMEKIHTKDSLENHPQWSAITNIINNIKSCESQETISQKSENIISKTYFNPCGEVSLTLERGIMHNPSEKLYLYDRNGINWSKLDKELKNKGLWLSETENCIYLGRQVKGTAWRYINSGNYELRFKCPYHTQNPFLSYSKLENSVTDSLKHRIVTSYSDKNLSHFAKRIKIQRDSMGKKCRYSDNICDYWIEFMPCN